MDYFAQCELPDWDSSDQIRDFTEYIHVVVYFGVESIVEDVTEEGKNGCYSVEKDDPVVKLIQALYGVLLRRYLLTKSILP